MISLAPGGPGSKQALQIGLGGQYHDRTFDPERPHLLDHPGRLFFLEIQITQHEHKLMLPHRVKRRARRRGCTNIHARTLEMMHQQTPVRR